MSRAAVVYENCAYGTSTTEPIKALAKSAGIDLMFFTSYPHGLTDASSQVTEIRRVNAQVLFPSATRNDVELIINTMYLGL